jgi:histone-lysine N-methyltransferase SETMAR
MGISRERGESIIHEDLDKRKVTKGVLFLHDNTPAHRSLATQTKLAYLCFQCLDHPHYSPDLAPSHYRLFPGLKKQLKGRHFSSDAVIAAAETWLDGQPSEILLSGLQKLEQRAKKCIEFRGKYVEQIPSLVSVAFSLSGRAKDLSAPLIRVRTARDKLSIKGLWQNKK